MNENKQYEIANLSAKDSLQLANLEKQFKSESGEQVILIAYQKKEGNPPSHNIHPDIQ
ncbi:hypothetical protein CLOSTMETH_03159 [[Clostridium] methylpentosum DSM 5476]|jgi:hypothetical protein|uniref:Uncharacterized protein n=1 Tax=[Clostridium] methylpentosum DSM 5476 TaxID=537013 RepID=C0EH14_9FIRM|nr:hypothetical protein CLOSTMETH_03159 [[Clostridium] methylpentosum DSM 5476]MDY3989015.1 hypothetical protein [Massilioclostridium sp.]MEE1491192.1 hypothetical protein [Massilioclostridium sp.]